MRGYFNYAGLWFLLAGLLLSVLAGALFLNYAPGTWADGVSPYSIATFAFLALTVGAICLYESR